MKKLLRTVLVEDEEFVRRDLTDLLRSSRQVELLGEASTAKEAREIISRLKPELVFLDLNLKGVHGFRVLEGLASIPAVIAVTAFSDHAVEGFSRDLADYIIKPVEEDRLRKALNRARDQIFLRSMKDDPGVPLEMNGHTCHISLSEILWAKANENYVEVFAVGGRGLIRSTFQNFCQRLPAGFSLEISRGHVVARHQISSWKRGHKGNLEIILKCGAAFRVSKRLQREVFYQLELLQ